MVDIRGSPVVSRLGGASPVVGEIEAEHVGGGRASEVVTVRSPHGGVGDQGDAEFGGAHVVVCQSGGEGATQGADDCGIDGAVPRDGDPIIAASRDGRTLVTLCGGGHF